MEISQAMATDLTDSAGAAAILTARFGRSFGTESVRKLVKTDRIRTFLFENGELVERKPGADTRGKDLLFLKQDLAAVPAPQRPGRRYPQNE